MADTSKKLAKLAAHRHGRPWAAVVAEVPASVATHVTWGDSPAAAAAMTLAAGGLTVATWAAGKGAPVMRRALATASTGAGTGYLLLATVTNPLDPTLLSGLGIGGAALAGTWNVVLALKSRDGSGKGKSETGVLVKALGEARARLRKTPTVEPNKVTAPLQLENITPDELGARIQAMAVELGVSPNAIRVLPDPDRADRPDLVIVPTDMLKQPTPWPGPAALGRSITEPIPLGVYEDGQVAQVWLPADEKTGRNASHFGVFGMNGSGKSAGWSIVAVEVMTRRDAVVWGCDPVKGIQTFGPLAPYMDWCETTMAGAEAMAAALPRVITARADALGRHGFKNWTPEAHRRLGMPYLVAWFEESAKLFREGVEMEGIVQEARSAGITVVLSQQRPSSTSLPTDVREQLGGHLVFGVKESTTADMALPDDVRDAGARPESWQNRRPGYCYVVAPGVPEDRYVIPARTYKASDDDLAGALALAPRPSVDPVTAAAAGTAYANRPDYGAAFAVADGLAAVGIDPESLARDVEIDVRQDDEDDDARADAQVMRALADAGMAPEDLAADVDPDREIPPVWHFGTPVEAGEERAERLTTEEAEEELLRILEEFRDQEREHIGPRDFKAVLGRLTRSRAWLSPRLAELADAGVHLEETAEPGVYRLLYPELANA